MTGPDRTGDGPVTGAATGHRAGTVSETGPGPGAGPKKMQSFCEPPEGKNLEEAEVMESVANFW